MRRRASDGRPQLSIHPARLDSPVEAPELRDVGGAGTIWHARIEIQPWTGVTTRDVTYGKGSATVTDSEGRSASAEVEVARRLTHAGWNARSLLITELPPEHWRPYVAMAADLSALPPRVNDLLGALGRPGAPDVFAWREHSGRSQLVAIECKRTGRDHVKRVQADWYSRAIAGGWIQRSHLAIVEWSPAR